MIVPAAPARPIRPLATAVIVLLAAQIALLGFRAVAFVKRIDLLRGMQTGELVTKAQAEASDQLVGVSVLLGLLAFLACSIVWLIWQYRAQANARALTNGGTSVSPGWAVGWWFIPFANLLKPFLSMHELWQASV